VFGNVTSEGLSRYKGGILARSVSAPELANMIHFVFSRSAADSYPNVARGTKAESTSKRRGPELVLEYFQFFGGDSWEFVPVQK